MEDSYLNLMSSTTTMTRGSWAARLGRSCCCSERQKRRDVGHGRQSVKVVLALEHLQVLTKVRRGYCGALSHSGLFHKPVSEDELQVEHKEGRAQTRSYLCVNLVL
jgi:hypothetical protein